MCERFLKIAAGALGTSFFLLAGLCLRPCAADVIHFKDGMQTVCQGRAWEENDEVRCEYDGALLKYSRADVARIEKTPTAQSPAAQDDAPPPRPPVAAVPAPAQVRPAPADPGGRGGPGPLFYDPKRPKKFWSSETGRHDTYAEAVAALAAEFGRSPQWVEEHIGTSNDLAAIRANLSNPSPAAAAAPPPAPGGAEGGVKFYDPRRPYKYVTGRNAQHATYEQALEALAGEYRESTQWVEAHMGESNDVDVIRMNLSEAQRQKGLQQPAQLSP
jgi:hypothetical protein